MTDVKPNQRWVGPHGSLSLVTEGTSHMTLRILARHWVMVEDGKPASGMPRAWELLMDDED